MSQVTLTAVVDESHVLYLQLPPEIVGEVDVIVRERNRPLKPNGPAILDALRNAPRSSNPNIWKESREELARMRDEWDDD